MKKILRFSASWCKPCSMLAETLQKANLGLPIEVVDIDVYPEYASEWMVRGIPTLVLVEDGKEIKRLVGQSSIQSLQEWAK